MYLTERVPFAKSLQLCFDLVSFYHHSWYVSDSANLLISTGYGARMSKMHHAKTNPQ